MSYKIIDVLNFIGNVKYIKIGNLLIDAYEWVNENGNIFVEVIDVERHMNGTATIIIKKK